LPTPHLRHRALQQGQHDARPAVREQRRAVADEARPELGDGLPRPDGDVREAVPALQGATGGSVERKMEEA
jgi:hypothetical protein